MTVHNKIDDQNIYDDILNIYNNKGDNKFKIEYYLVNGKYSKAPIKRLGGWNEILKYLNIKQNNHFNVSKEEAIKDFISFKSKYDSLSSTLYRKYGSYSQKTIDDLFGNFAEFVKAAGFIPKRETRNMNNEGILKVLKDLYDKEGYVNSTLISEKSSFTYQTVLNRFGTMSNVYELLNIDNDVNKNSYFSTVNKVLEMCSQVLNEKSIKEWTCKELMNPELTNHLYVDGYFPEHNLVVEYDGQQHYEFVKFLHKTQEKFERTKILDKHKEKILNDLNIKLIRIRYDDPININFIKEKLN